MSGMDKRECNNLRETPSLSGLQAQWSESSRRVLQDFTHTHRVSQTLLHMKWPGLKLIFPSPHLKFLTAEVEDATPGDPNAGELFFKKLL